MDAAQRSQQRLLLEALSGPAAEPTPADAQAVFCIDVRSEGLRRHLEAVAPVETFGFAGFFGLPMAYRGIAGGEATSQVPALIEPRFVADERPVAGGLEEAARAVRAQRTVAGAEDGFQAAELGTLAPLALAEATGWVAGPVAAVKTLLPSAWSAARRRALRPTDASGATEVRVDRGMGLRRAGPLRQGAASPRRG